MGEPRWTFGCGVTGRADWLRLVYVGETGATGLPPAIAAELLGFVGVPREAVGLLRSGGDALPTVEVALPVGPSESVPDATALWRVIGPELKAEAEGAARTPPAFLQGKVPASLGARSLVPLEPRPLIPRARLGRLLQQQLRCHAPGSELDLARLVDRIARLRPLPHLPRLVRPCWSPRLQLYWDQARAIAFCWQDQWHVWQWLRRWRGSNGLELVVVDPGGSARVVSRRGGPRPLTPDPQTTVLALSDLGAADGSETRRELWARVAQGAARAGARTVALVLCPPSLWPEEVARQWHPLPWYRCSRGLSLANRLLRLLSPAVRIEPALLRAVRLLLASEGADLGTELRAWNDPRVAIRSREGMALELSAMRALRREFYDEPLPLREAVAGVIRSHHRLLATPLRAEELLACETPFARLRAQAMLARYARRLNARGVDQSTPTEARYLDRLEARQSSSAWSAGLLAAVWALAHRRPDRSGFEKSLPPGLELQQVLWALAAPPPQRWCRLWQRGACLECWPAASRDEPWPERPGAPLAELPLRFGQLRVSYWELEADAGPLAMPRAGAEGGERRYRRLLGRAEPQRRSLMLDVDARSMLELPAFSENGPVVQVETDMAQLELRPERRPPWAIRFERQRSGLWLEATVRTFGVIVTESAIAESTSWSRGARSVLVPPAPARASQRPVRERLLFPTWATRLDQDGRGFYAELEIAPGITTRLRWIPPGSFWMGSPETETGRIDREGPQHRVELTRGFWLGEAPCTQGEWEAVMGENPSEFQDNPEEARQRPVEQVSWEDCQGFCEKLNERIGDLGARFPSEAEWEYACRAGTASAYHDGSDCTEPAGADPALERLGWYDKNSGGTTHPVRQLEPNAWGLCDLHGNVWEWCMDWYGPYERTHLIDPTGPADGSGRVIRGGCWGGRARVCRSAYRNGGLPTGRGSDLGFRFAAGLVSPASGKEQAR